MSLNELEASQYCKHIIESRQIRNRLVILCEGSIGYTGKKPSPQTYKQMEKMPDANFYKNCIPRSWRERIPQFFNCGDRGDVIRIYHNLISLHQENSQASYLTPEKLFAIVDLDIQSQPVSSQISTEDIYKELYVKGDLDLDAVAHNRIWVTGLIHKEAYFLMPCLQPIFDDFPGNIMYNGETLRLENIYIDMLNDIYLDEDLKVHFSSVCHRIIHCLDSSSPELEDCCSSLKKSDISLKLERSYETYIKALLSIRKAKPYWQSIDSEESVGNIRDRLRLEIARFFSESESFSSELHIPGFFKFLSSIK